MESERSTTPSSYTLQPTRFCNEDILFCTDIDLESQVEMKVSGPKGRPITRLESIKQTILLFVHAKLAINPDHRFCFATLGQSASWNQKEFSNEIESAIAAVRGLGQLAHSSYGHADLTQLFRLAAHEAKKSRLQNRILRVILIYCRSSVQPQYQWTTNQKLFTLDVIYLHDKPGPENCPQKVYDALVDALERVSEYEGYIYESGQGLSRVLFKLTCLLLSHPQQRCVQDDIDFPKSLAKKSPAPESTPDFKEFRAKTVMGVCISIPSSMIQEAKAEAAGHENVLLIQDPVNSSQGLPGRGSVHSQQGDKGTNQDSAILHQGYGTAEGAFCGVFDGHGVNGHKVSKLVRNHLPSLLSRQRSAFALEDGEELVTNNVFDEWKRACVSAFKVMDKELKLQHNLDCSCSGSTAVTIIKQGEDLVIANLGDSRAVLGTITKTDELKAVQLTVDLKPDLPSEAERIRRCNGRVFAHEDEPDVQRVWSPDNDFASLAMARAFGDFYFKKYGVISIPQISYRRLTSRDQFLVLATDGVWDVLSNEEVASIVWSVESEGEASKAVVEAAVAEWEHKFPSTKVDDCTVVCLFLQERKQENPFG